MPKINSIKGKNILYRHWPSDKNDAVFLLVHGLGAHTDRWNFMAGYFNQQGFSSYAIELKGFGETKDLKGHVDSFNTYYQDIKTLHAQIKKDNPGKKIFIIGESMGGLIVFLLVSANPGMFAGQILISPAFANVMKFPLKDYINLTLSIFYNQKKEFQMPFTSAMCTRDEIYQKVMDADSRELRTATTKTLINILTGQVQAGFVAKLINIPTLFLLAGKDMLVAPKASKAIFKKIKMKDKTLIDYPEMHHALSIDKDREKVFTDILKWINQRLDSNILTGL